MQLIVQTADVICGCPPLKDLITVCYGDYSESIEDTADFAPSHRRYTSADAWRYQVGDSIDIWKGIS